MGLETAEKTDPKGEISLKELIKMINSLWLYLLSKWVIIGVVAVVFASLGLVYSLIGKTTYKAELSFALEDDKSGSGGLGGALGLASQFGIDLGDGAGGEFSGDNLLALMKSRSMIQRALITPVQINGKSVTLADFYIQFNQLHDQWQGKPDLENISFPPGADPSKFSLKQDSILGVFHKNILKSNLTVDKVDKKLSIISLSIKSTNEFFSKTFVEVLAKVVSDFYVQTKTQKASKNVAILQKQTDSVRNMLNAAISGVATYADINPNPNPALQSLRVPSQRKQVDVTANTAILSELVRNLEASKMTLLQETPLIQVIDRPILPLDKEKFSKLKGLVLGGLIGVVLAVFWLSLKVIFKKIMA